MVTVTYGGKRGTPFELVESDEHLVIRTAARSSPRAVQLSAGAQEVLSRFEVVLQFPEAGVEVLKVVRDGAARQTRDIARSTLASDPQLEFAGRVLTDHSGEPVIYTENVFVKFRDAESETRCKAVLAGYGLEPRARFKGARNAFFTAAAPRTGRQVFDLAERLLHEEAVELCHPELVRQVRRRRAFPEQWHLKKTKIGGVVIDASARVQTAWRKSRGAGVVIAVIDDGIDVDHEEFALRGKIVSPYDATFRDSNPRPGSQDDHGTACAGVACASGRKHAAGVAPSAKLMPIRLASGLGSRNEAEAFVWAADHGADVISCSWGPVDGRWNVPQDPQHNVRVPLPDSTRLAMEYAIAKGRKGLGCVIVFAAGNGNESVDNDGYASFPKVMAVAACNDSGKKSCYSDHGEAVWCAFPSSDLVGAGTPGIWTTDRTGRAGYNPGRKADGDLLGNYTNSFGGTSSSAPGVAGVAALVLARNPSLRWNEVKDLIRRSCERIDEAGGAYDSEGHSKWYGYGRIDAARAVALARPERRRKGKRNGRAARKAA